MIAKKYHIKPHHTHSDGLMRPRKEARIKKASGTAQHVATAQLRVENAEVLALRTRLRKSGRTRKKIRNPTVTHARHIIQNVRAEVLSKVPRIL